MKYILRDSAEKVEVLPIEVPSSPPTNGDVPHISLELDLPGTPERSRECNGLNIAHKHHFASSENDITDITTLDSRSSKDLSETSSDVSAESDTLLLSSSSKSAVNTNSRNSVKKKNQSNTEQHEDEFEMSVIHNGKIVDDIPTAATC